MGGGRRGGEGGREGKREGRKEGGMGRDGRGRGREGGRGKEREEGERCGERENITTLLACQTTNALTLFPTYFGSRAFEMQQPSTGVRGSSDRAILSSLLKRCDSFPPTHVLSTK